MSYSWQTRVANCSAMLVMLVPSFSGISVAMTRFLWISRSQIDAKRESRCNYRSFVFSLLQILAEMRRCVKGLWRGCPRLWLLFGFCGFGLGLDPEGNQLISDPLPFFENRIDFAEQCAEIGWVSCQLETVLLEPIFFVQNASLFV